MENKYKIIIQFADPNAPDFTEAVMPVLQKAVDSYNARSRLASNAKQISEMTILDLRTLQIVLESCNELPFPGKALRLFTSYLIDPKIKGSLSAYIYGKQLFKMTSQKIEESEATVPENTEDLSEMRLNAIALLLHATEEAVIKVIEILEANK